jgi:hypothetical protein
MFLSKNKLQNMFLESQESNSDFLITGGNKTNCPLNNRS